MTIIVTNAALGATVSAGATFVRIEHDIGPSDKWLAIAQSTRQLVDNTAVIKIKIGTVEEIRSDPLRTLEEIDRHLQQKAAEVIDAWKNQPAFSLSSALGQIKKNLGQ